MDESFHPMLIQSFIDRFAPMFPQYSPQAFTMDVGRTVILPNVYTWDKIQRLDVSSCSNKSSGELIHMAEYLIACALGSYHIIIQFDD